MRLPLVRALLGVLLFGFSLHALATHQVGGQIEMRAVGDRPGHFKIIITNYYEAGTQGANRLTTGAGGIYRLRDNFQMLTFQTVETKAREAVVYSNIVCANQRNQNVSVATFEADIQLDPATYNDSGGYYISYQTRNRNGGIDNIVNPLNTGFTFYLEFPSLQKGGAYFTNSSPHFGAINGEYICINQPFTFAFGGTDPDGDELRYSMITPLDQKTAGGTIGGNGTPSPGPYPDISWLSGYSATNAIPGSPPLSVDPKTGELSVIANKLGLYVFAIKVEEYRNGEKIGEVRRDFQFLVIDCPPPVTINPKATIASYPTSAITATICQGASATLVSNTNPNWLYQWRRDGINLPNATTPTIDVKEPGMYSVLVSLSGECSRSSESQKIQISVVNHNTDLRSSGHLCATDGSVRFDVDKEDYVTYEWLRDGRLLSGQTADSLRVSEPGMYQVRATDTRFGCVKNGDPLTITRSAAVTATIRSASGFNNICPNDSLQLNAGGGLSYSWQKDGNSLVGVTGTSYTIKTVGTYSLTAIDSYGCKGVSPPLVIGAIPPITVTMDTLLPVCGTIAAAYTLKGSPGGGLFEGPGVTGNTFSPATAGIGDHVITYGVKPAPQCAPTVTQRTAVVSPIPTIQLPDSLITFLGNTFTLEPVITGNANWFQWEPSTFLSRTDVANPEVINIGKDGITYHLWTKNKYECERRDTIRIIVVERLWIPDAFTPNHDGVNDVWVLKGIEAFPEAEITVFNRWGEIIYWNKNGNYVEEPFSGLYKGDWLATGPYAYVIRPSPKRPELRGTVFILR